VQADMRAGPSTTSRDDGPVNTFWIIGIALNVVFFGLAAWWVLRNMCPPRRDQPPDPER